MSLLSKATLPVLFCMALSLHSLAQIRPNIVVINIDDMGWKETDALIPGEFNPSYISPRSR